MSFYSLIYDRGFFYYWRTKIVCSSHHCCLGFFFKWVTSFGNHIASYYIYKYKKKNTHTHSKSSKKKNCPKYLLRFLYYYQSWWKRDEKYQRNIQTHTSKDEIKLTTPCKKTLTTDHKHNVMKLLIYWP